MVGIVAVVHARSLVLQLVGILLAFLVVVHIHIQTEARRNGVFLRILRGHHPHNLVDVVPDILGHRDGLLFPQGCAVRILPVLCFQAVPDQGLLLIAVVTGFDVEFILNLSDETHKLIRIESQIFHKSGIPVEIRICHLNIIPYHLF